MNSDCVAEQSAVKLLCGVTFIVRGLTMFPIASSVRNALKCALLPGLAFFALTAGANVAQATVLNGTFHIDIYQGFGSTGNINDPEEQAVITNPLIIAANKIDSADYTGDLNFNDGGTNTIGSFLNFGGGDTSNFAAGTLTKALSASGFALTSVFVITGTVTGEIINGGIQHDDGATLYDSGGALASAPGPVTEQTLNYSGLTGDWTLVYVAANNIPEVLQFNVGSSESTITPLPASAWLFGSVLAGSGLFFGRRRKRQPAAAA
jgi:hypothetical protein